MFFLHILILYPCNIFNVCIRYRGKDVREVFHHRRGNDCPKPNIHHDFMKHHIFWLRYLAGNNRLTHQNWRQHRISANSRETGLSAGVKGKLRLTASNWTNSWRTVVTSCVHIEQGCFRKSIDSFWPHKFFFFLEKFGILKLLIFIWRRRRAKKYSYHPTHNVVLNVCFRISSIRQWSQWC